MMIERVCKSDLGTVHDRKAGGIDGRQLVQVRPPKVFPGLLQITQFAGEDF
jgi:hypothetical protein